MGLWQSLRVPTSINLHIKFLEIANIHHLFYNLVFMVPNGSNPSGTLFVYIILIQQVSHLLDAPKQYYSNNTAIATASCICDLYSSQRCPSFLILRHRTTEIMLKFILQRLLANPETTGCNLLADWLLDLKKWPKFDHPDLSDQPPNRTSLGWEDTFVWSVTDGECWENHFQNYIWRRWNDTCLLYEIIWQEG